MISIAKLFEEEEPKKHGRSLFKLDEKEKNAMEEERILLRLKRQEGSKKYFEYRTMTLDKKIKKSQEKLRKNKQNLQQQEDENNPPELGNLKVNENKGFFSPLFPLNETINFFLGTVYGASKKNQNKTKDQMEEEKILGDLTQK